MSVEGLLLGIGLSSAVVAGLIAIRTTADRRAVSAPVLTLSCFVVIGAFSLAQLVVAPSLLPSLMRDAGLVRSGQFWRLVTSLLVQDGGWSGAALNLIELLAIGAVAERMFGRREWGIVGAISVAAAQLVALSWQPAGAGNSILNFGLAGAVCGACFTNRAVRQSLVPSVVASVCFILLLLRQDIHGVAAVCGALVMCTISLRA